MLLGLGENNGLYKGVHRRRFTGQTAFEPLLDLVAEGGEGLGVALADALKRRSERGHKDRAEEKGVLGGQGFLVSVTLVVVPHCIRELVQRAILDGELPEVSVSCEGDEKIVFPPGISSHDHS